MEQGLSAISALTDPAEEALRHQQDLAAEGPAPHTPQRETSVRSVRSVRSVWSLLSTFPTPYVWESGRRVSILRKLNKQLENRSRRRQLLASFGLIVIYLGA